MELRRLRHPGAW